MSFTILGEEGGMQKETISLSRDARAQQLHKKKQQSLLVRPSTEVSEVLQDPPLLCAFCEWMVLKVAIFLSGIS